MQTEIKSFNNIPVRDRPKKQLKYTDVVSYVVFVSLLPLICLHAMVISPLVGFNLLISFLKFDTVSEHLESTIRYFSSFITSIFTRLGYSMSILLSGIYFSVLTYEINKPIILAMGPVSLDVIDFSKLANVHRNAMTKNGIFSVWLRCVVMLSGLPMVRSILTYNPYLFQLSLFFTNQFTKDIDVDERTDENFQTIERIFHTYAGKCSESEALDAVVFNPNYTECITDDGRFNDIGMQFSRYWMTYIQMELPKIKKEIVSFDYTSPILANGVKCKLLDRLWVSYRNPYHPIVSYVEVILTENGSMQHPMMGLIADSVYAVYTWSCIDNLFQQKVFLYIEEQYQNNKSPNTTVNILSA